MIFTRNKGKDDKPADVKVLRDTIIRFIKNELQKYQGGEARNVHQIGLFINCADTELPFYESAVYQNEKDRFKKEIQKIADDYAIDLPDDWQLALVFDELPEMAIKSINGIIGILINVKERKNNQSIQKAVEYAQIRVLNGQTEQPTYTIDPEMGRINIGRGQVVELPDGSSRINHITFTIAPSNIANQYISRQHAHLEWNNEKKCFMLYADAGGLPPANKTKVKNAKLGQVYKLQTTGIGYALADYDQLILGESAVLEIRYDPDVN